MTRNCASCFLGTDGFESAKKARGRRGPTGEP